MNKFRLTVVWLMATLFTCGAGHACSPMPQPFFHAPSYIDPDFKDADWLEVRYNRQTMFRILLSQYAKLRPFPEECSDSVLRAASQREEPELYAAYLKGAERFRAFDCRSALTVFSDLRTTTTPRRSLLDRIFSRVRYSWVREASTYMIARSQLNIAQLNWDGYSSPAGEVDQEMLQLADSSYRQYLKEYPSGVYAKSARDIQRKIVFLAGQQESLNQALKQAMLDYFPSSSTANANASIDAARISEFESYFKGEFDFAHDSPILAAYAWLGPTRPNPQDLAVLKGRERDFAAYPGLFRFVRALGLYKLERYQELLDKTPDAPAGNGPIWLSTELLRARAFERIGDSSAALGVLWNMHGQFLEGQIFAETARLKGAGASDMAIYVHLKSREMRSEDQIDIEMACLKLNSGDGLWLFTNECPLSDTRNLRAFALAGLSDGELESGLTRSDIARHKKQILADELARRYVLSRRYFELARLLDTLPIKTYESAMTTIDNLSANPHDVQSLVDIGEFLYKNAVHPAAYFDGIRFDRWEINPATGMAQCIPCKHQSSRMAEYTPPMWFFVTVAEAVRKSGVRSEAEAKALHYIVVGSRSGPNRDHCTWYSPQYDDPSLKLRKGAFLRLHSVYKDSPWAAATPYWYK